MLSYSIKRILYSIWILLGILLITFLLFRVAAGDPTAILLGKNPTPQDVEQMRDALGSGKPLFFGHWCKTELYTSADFTGKHSEFPGIELTNVTAEEDGLHLNSGCKLVFQRHFAPASGRKIRLTVCGNALLKINETVLNVMGKSVSVELEDVPETLEISLAENSEDRMISEISFEKSNPTPFDSQALDALKELVVFRSTFPYVSFFNFGNTLLTREPIRAKLLRGMVPSLVIMIPIFIGELVFGVILALISCAFRDTLLDRTIVVFSVAGMSISYLVLIILGQWFLAYYLNLFPVWGWDSPRCVALPVILGIISGTGSGVRFYRTVFIDEIRKEYLRTALSKGASPVRLYGVHLLRNALIPILTRASTVLPFLFTGSLLLESFFGIPGLGYEGVNALNSSDLGMLKALVLLGALLFIAINLITDLLYAWVDPRIRVE